MKSILKHITVFILALFFVLPTTASSKKFVVVIDPGHGGHDSGAVGKITTEKVITLSISLKLGELISKNHKDVKVLYTRKTDKFIPLHERADFANKNNANLFISVHANSTKNKSAHGAETYILGHSSSKEQLEVAKRENSVIIYEENYEQNYMGFDPNSTESYILFEFMTNKFLDQSLKFAGTVQNNIIKNTNRRNRGVKQNIFLVLRKTGMPSVLIELGFISNANEEKFMHSQAGQKKLANSIYEAFNTYKKQYDKDNGNHIVKAPSNNNKQNESSPKTTSTKTANTKDKDIEYRVQILSSPKLYKDNNKIFKGLTPIKHYKEGNIYRYTYGSTKSKEEANRLQKKARSKFKDAFVVKFSKGKRVK